MLTADEATWDKLAGDVTAGMDAFRRGRLQVRRNLHLGVGFLAATAGATGPGRFRFHGAPHAGGRVLAAGGGNGRADRDAARPRRHEGVLSAERGRARGLVSRDRGRHARVRRLDKPLGASYSPPFQAGAITKLLDTLELPRAHFVGHSLGGRVAMEFGFNHPERAGGLVLMTPAMAWLRERRWAPYLRLVRPELGLFQIAPRRIVETFMRWAIPGGDSPWAAPAIDEFVRIFTTARGRAAFYAAARHIYLDEPHGDNGFWTKLETLSPESLFIWGRKDPLVRPGS